MTDSQTADAPPALWRLFASGAIGFALIGALPALYGVALPAQTRIFDLAEGQAGLLLSAHGTGAFLTVFAGIFGIRWLTMRLSLALIGTGAAVLAMEISWPVMLLGGFITGSGFGLLSAIVNQRFLDEFGTRGPGMVGLVNALFGVGAIASPIFFVAAGGAPGIVFAGIAVIGFALIPLVQPSGRGMSRSRGMPELRRWPMLMLGFIFFAVLIEVALFGFGPTALINAGLDEFAAARLTSVFFLAFLLGRLSLYWLTRWINADLLYLAGLAIIAVSAFVAGLGAASAGFVVAGAGIGILFPVFYVWGSDVLGRDPRIGSAILTAALSAGAIGPVIVQALVRVFGYDMFFWIIAVLTTLACGIAIVAIRLIRRMQRA